MIDLKELFNIINKETLTQKEVSKKIKRSVRTVKQMTHDGILHAYKLKSDTLYGRKEIK